jgi:hypothetical protein
VKGTAVGATAVVAEIPIPTGAADGHVSEPDPQVSGAGGGLGHKISQRFGGRMAPRIDKGEIIVGIIPFHPIQVIRSIVNRGILDIKGSNGISGAIAGKPYEGRPPPTQFVIIDIPGDRIKVDTRNVFNILEKDHPILGNQLQPGNLRYITELPILPGPLGRIIGGVLEFGVAGGIARGWRDAGHIGHDSIRDLQMGNRSKGTLLIYGYIGGVQHWVINAASDGIIGARLHYPGNDAVLLLKVDERVAWSQIISFRETSLRLAIVSPHC